MTDKPVQPRNYKFPTKLFNNRYRAFSPSLYDTYKWIEYSIEKDVAFCNTCRFFSTSHHDNPFTSTGFSNWKQAHSGETSKLEKHDKSENHQHAECARNKYKRTQAQGTCIASVLSSERKEQIRKNRCYMKAVLHSLKFCSFQEIALRGHREVESKNRGIYVELLHLIGQYDTIVSERLQHGPRNAIYTSHNIQDEIINLLAKQVRLAICNEVKEAGYYSIIVDESRDTAKQEQMSFVVRYFNTSDKKMHERFLGFLHAECLDAGSLSEYILGLITEYDFDINKLVSQGYDGASVVQAKIREIAPQAAYIHCHAHVLNLVLVDSVKSMPSASEFCITRIPLCLSFFF